jgi:hypothetical protein
VKVEYHSGVPNEVGNVDFSRVRNGQKAPIIVRFGRVGTERQAVLWPAGGSRWPVRTLRRLPRSSYPGRPTAPRRRVVAEVPGGTDSWTIATVPPCDANPWSSPIARLAWRRARSRRYPRQDLLLRRVRALSLDHPRTVCGGQCGGQLLLRPGLVRLGLRSRDGDRSICSVQR